METFNKDELFSLAIKLDLPDLIALCQTNKRFHEALYFPDTIWLFLLKTYFPSHDQFNLKLSPRETYNLLYQLTQLKEKLALLEKEE